MKVAFVAPLVAPLSDATARGNHVVLADLARGLTRRGHDVVVFCAQGSYLSGVECAPIAVDPRASSGALVSGERRGGRNEHLARAFEELFGHLRDWGPDVVAQHAFDVEPFEACAGLPVAHTLHLNPTVDDVVDAARRAVAPLAAVSRDSAARWSRAVGRPVRAIPNGVPPIPVPTAVSAAEPIALIPGRISPEKGTACAIRVARRAGLEPLVVGEVYDRAYFAREVTPLLDGVHLFRTLPRERVWRLMAHAAVTLVPVAWDEPFGLVAAEAQLVGCPVAGYARGALPEVVGDTGGCLVAPGDEDALTAAVSAVRALDRAAIRDGARDRFDLERMLDAHEELLAEAAGGTRALRQAA